MRALNDDLVSDGGVDVHLLDRIPRVSGDQVLVLEPHLGHVIADGQRHRSVD